MRIRRRGAPGPKVTEFETTVFVYDASSKLIAEYSNETPENPNTSYIATDTLLSVRLVTDRSGNVVSRRDFQPFGEELTADGSARKSTDKYSTATQDKIRQRFTGYLKDIETGLDFAEARMYENRHGRFTVLPVNQPRSGGSVWPCDVSPRNRREESERAARAATRWILDLGLPISDLIRKFWSLTRAATHSG